MRDLGDGWSIEWCGPEVFSLFHCGMSHGFDVRAGTGETDGAAVVFVTDIRGNWDPPHEKEQISDKERAEMIAALRRINRGGVLRRHFARRVVLLEAW